MWYRGLRCAFVFWLSLVLQWPEKNTAQLWLLGLGPGINTHRTEPNPTSLLEPSPAEPQREQSCPAKPREMQSTCRLMDIRINEVSVGHLGWCVRRHHCDDSSHTYNQPFDANYSTDAVLGTLKISLPSDNKTNNNNRQSYLSLCSRWGGGASEGFEDWPRRYDNQELKYDLYQCLSDSKIC